MMGKKKYRISNWADYNKALKQPSSFTVWMEKGFEKLWYAVSTSKRGRPLLYSEACMKLIRTVRHVFKLALRQLEGFLNSLFDRLKIKLRVPEFSRFKTIFGRQFLSRTWERQEVELPLICDMLNKMTSLGMPTSVKVR